MEIDLRQAAVQDLELILPLVRAYHAFEQLDTTAAERKSAVGRLLRSPDFGGIWLVYCDQALAGYIALCRGFSIEFNGFDAFVDEFYLGEAFRGQGVGTQVLQTIKATARQFDINALHLEVARDNDAAQKLYRRAGFQPREKYLLMSAELREQE